MSKIILFNAVAGAIEALKPSFHFGGLFNNQFAKEGVEDAHRWPMVYLEFSSLDWSAGLGTIVNNQQAEVEFILHIGFKEIRKSDEVHDLMVEIDKIYQAIHGLSLPDFDPVRRIRETQATDWDNVFGWQIAFRTTLMDRSAVNLGYSVTFANDITINRDLVVENPVIRSGVTPVD